MLISDSADANATRRERTQRSAASRSEADFLSIFWGLVRGRTATISGRVALASTPQTAETLPLKRLKRSVFFQIFDTTGVARYPLCTFLARSLGSTWCHCALHTETQHIRSALTVSISSDRSALTAFRQFRGQGRSQNGAKWHRNPKIPIRATRQIA